MAHLTIRTWQELLSYGRVRAVARNSGGDRPWRDALAFDAAEWRSHATHRYIEDDLSHPSIDRILLDFPSACAGRRVRDGNDRWRRRAADAARIQEGRRSRRGGSGGDRRLAERSEEAPSGL